MSRVYKLYLHFDVYFANTYIIVEMRHDFNRSTYMTYRGRYKTMTISLNNLNINIKAQMSFLEKHLCLDICTKMYVYCTVNARINDNTI